MNEWEMNDGLLTLGLGPKPEVKIKTGSFNLKFEP